MKLITLLIIVLITPLFAQASTLDEFTSKYAEVYSKNDINRKIATVNSPRYLESVGHIFIDSPKGHKQFCSAVLITFGFSFIASKVAVSSEHCLNHDELFKFYQQHYPKTKPFSADDILKDIYIEFYNKKQNKVYTRKIFEMVDENHETDRITLILDNKLNFNEIMPMVVEKQDEDLSQEDLDFFETPLGVAGFSTTDSIDNNGQFLTYDEKCKLFNFDDPNKFLGENFNSFAKFYAATDCFAYPGASGGAFYYVENDSDDEDTCNQKYAILLGIFKGVVVTDKDNLSRIIISSNISDFGDYLYLNFMMNVDKEDQLYFEDGNDFILNPLVKHQFNEDCSMDHYPPL